MHFKILSSTMYLDTFLSRIMNPKLLFVAAILLPLSACQLISPIFVNYNGVRMDVAKWINNQSLLSMQQKRSLAQLSKAQQKLVRINEIPENKKLEISKDNTIAMICARRHLTEYKITQLQNQVFGKDERVSILEQYEQQFPKVKLDAESIICE